MHEQLEAVIYFIKPKLYLFITVATESVETDDSDDAGYEESFG